MGTIQVLDCTLRDGGYCNNWNFGKQNIHKIIKGLIDANIDIVECGFLTKKNIYQEGTTQFTKLKEIDEFIPNVSTRQIFVAMINYGEYTAEDLPKKTQGSLDGIRVAFHKKDAVKALELCKKIKEKGYYVFIQPMVSMNYNDTEFIRLLEAVNQILPYACYLVDSFGMMKKDDLIHYLELMTCHLKKNISIGFHAHNNFQSALSNAQLLLEQETSHDLIIDSSIYGMGRGAGNLNSELFINELNGKSDHCYALKPLLQVMDEVITCFYAEHPWGYSLPNYLSASHMIHPNYANYLSEKNTLTLDAMNDIFSMMDKEKAEEFSPEYIEKLYIDYMAQGKTQNIHLDEFKKIISEHNVLLIAPGKTGIEQKERIQQFAENPNVIVIGINHEPDICRTDYIFVSNMRRFKRISKNVYNKMITTTNIKASLSFLNLDYYSLTNPSEIAHDNAGMMAIQFMINIGCREVWLAGYDGYEYQTSQNYEDQNMALTMKEYQIDELNIGMQKMLEKYALKIKINFLTQTHFKIKEAFYYGKI